MTWVYICWVKGSCEDFYRVHATEAACKADLVRWCKAYWQPNIDGPMPDDDEKILDIMWKQDIEIWWEGPIPFNVPYEPRGPAPERPELYGPPTPERMKAVDELEQMVLRFRAKHNID